MMAISGITKFKVSKMKKDNLMKKFNILRWLRECSIGNTFYSRAVNLCRNKLSGAFVPAWKKFILISVIVVFSQVNISLSSPVSRSVWLSSQYAIASTVDEEGSGYILSAGPKDELLHYLWSKEDLAYQVYSRYYAFADADMLNMVLLHDVKSRAGLLPQEERIAPSVFLRAPPKTVHGPPYWSTYNVTDLSRWPSCQSIKNSLALLLRGILRVPQPKGCGYLSKQLVGESSHL